MYRMSRHSFLRGGIYHLCLILIAFSALNWGFLTLTGIDIAGRVFAGVTIPPAAVALALCFGALIVLWNNWVD
ncbi:MAG: hypothetical protein ABI758_01935 [Candidatus Woesebacteria bacterium]